jgi:FkbM family methyltransferase
VGRSLTALYNRRGAGSRTPPDQRSAMVRRPAYSTLIRRKAIRLTQPEQPSTVPPRLHEQQFMAIKNCKHGTFLYNVHDLFIGRSLDLYGQWCEGELSILGQILHAGDVVLDVGANIGTHTVFFSRQVTQQGFVIAFEPQRIVFQNLCANLALNGLVNAWARQQGVGRQAGAARLPVFDPSTPMNFGGVRLTGHGEGEPVQIVSIDDLSLPRCNLIKIDVEGMEREVLEGARQTIGRHRPVLFVENNTVEGSPAILALLDALEYDAWWHIENYYRPDNFFRNPTNVFEQFQPEANLVCIHRSCPATINGLPKVTGLDDNWRLAVTRMG